jgi:site-specific DNA-methyltransferase (adenine-specific)
MVSSGTSAAAGADRGGGHRIIHADNLAVLAALPDASVELVYIDPPFNTGKCQQRTRLRTVADPGAGDRTGFQGKRYRTIELGRSGWDDRFDDFLAFIEPRLLEIRRVLGPDGSLFLHLDPREVHYCKVLLDGIFGRECFQNEIIWAYDYGARSKSRWPAKHDNILWYAKDPANFVFNYDEIDRIPYLAPALVGAEKAERGKTPTDVWWHTIVSPTGREKTGYPTQKPLGVIERIVRVHSRPGGLVADFFAGSGTTGEAAAKHGRRFLLVDDNPEAVGVMERRLARFEPEVVRRLSGSPG